MSTRSVFRTSSTHNLTYRALPELFSQALIVARLQTSCSPSHSFLVNVKSLFALGRLAKTMEGNRVDLKNIDRDNTSVLGH